jgi:hypothetical protein
MQTCHVCSTELPVASFAYAIDHNNNKICLECATKQELQFLEHNTKAVLYLVRDKAAEVADRLNGSRSGKRYAVTNCIGKIKFPVSHWHTGKHNWGIPRIDVWFTDHQGNEWWGVHYGVWNELVYCKKLKRRSA